MNVHELQEKFSNKKEIFNFLTQDCEAYLPNIHNVNINILKQITRAQKEVRLVKFIDAVHQALSCEGGSGALNSRVGSRRLYKVCETARMQA